jgi:hypothetical protein
MGEERALAALGALEQLEDLLSGSAGDEEADKVREAMQDPETAVVLRTVRFKGGQCRALISSLGKVSE